MDAGGLGPRRPLDPAEVEQLRQSRERVLGRIRAAAERAGRDPDAVRLVAVSKTVQPARLRAAVAAGLTVFGENRVQEAAAKAPEVEGATWHLVGPLQSNKARQAVGLFDTIEAVDSVELVRRLDRLAAELRPGRRLPIYLEVNIDRDPAKAGFSPEAVGEALATMGPPANVAIEGLMTVGRQVARPDEARPTFRALRELSTELRSRFAILGGGLSMGMTDDFGVAVEEGATLVRVGRALFGERHAL